MSCQRLLMLAGLAVFGLALVPAAAPAQSFTRPVRIIVPFAPGGTSDILARLIGEPEESGPLAVYLEAAAPDSPTKHRVYLDGGQSIA